VSALAKKTFDDLSCAFRHWRGDQRLGSMHGYALAITLRMRTTRSEPGAAGLVDFSKFGSIKQLLQNQFDHTLLVADDDPEAATFVGFGERTGTRVHLMPNVALDGIATWVMTHCDAEVTSLDPFLKLVGVRVQENARSSIEIAAGFSEVAPSRH
jgi:6-pyruvoyltetrahydropterin/6-carboxytetrahydropterin synthase